MTDHNKEKTAEPVALEKRGVGSGGNPVALLPIGVFVVLYLGLGIVFEYALKIEMGFYNIFWDEL